MCLTGSRELGAEADFQRKDTKYILPYIYQRNGPRDKELYQAPPSSLTSLKTSVNNLASWDTENKAGSDKKKKRPSCWPVFTVPKVTMHAAVGEKSQWYYSVSSHILQFWPSK